MQQAGEHLSVNSIDSLNARARAAIFTEDRSLAVRLSADALAQSKQKNYLPGIAAALSTQASIAQVFDDDFLKEEQLSLEALAVYKNITDTSKIGHAYIAYAFARFAQSDYLAAIRYQQMAVGSFHLHQRPLDEALALVTLSNIYSEKGVYDTAFAIAEQGLALAEAINNARAARRALHMIAAIYSRIGEYESALAAHRKAGDYPVNNNHPPGNGLADLQLAEALAKLHKFDDAARFYNSIDTTRLSEQEFRFYLVSKGEFELETGRYNSAITYLNRGLARHRAKKDGNEVMRALNDLAMAWLALNNTQQSLSYGLQALDMAKDVGSKQGLLSAYNAIYQSYKIDNRYDSALHFFSGYVMMKDTVMSAQTKGRIAAYTYEQVISRLHAENSLRNHELTSVSNEKRLILLAAVIAILLLVAIGRNMQLQRARAEQLRQMALNQLDQEKLRGERNAATHEKQKVDLEMKMLRAQMNPHFIFNSLNSINLYILQNNAEQASEYLTLFSKLVRMILQHSRNALISLEDEITALKLYMEMEAMRFNGRFDYSFVIPEEVDTFSLKVPPMVIQPFVENAIWHGLMKKTERGQLQIILSIEDDFLIYNVIDNGIGREKAKQQETLTAASHSPLGLKITAERISLMSKQIINNTPIVIEDLVDASGAAAGTSVTIKIPLVYESDTD